MLHTGHKEERRDSRKEEYPPQHIDRSILVRGLFEDYEVESIAERRCYRQNIAKKPVATAQRAFAVDRPTSIISAIFLIFAVRYAI